MSTQQLLVNPQEPYAFWGDRTDSYRLLVFAAMVAGKSAMPTARKLTELLTRFPELDYPGMLRGHPDAVEVNNALRIIATGKYTLLTRFFMSLHDFARADMLSPSIVDRDYLRARLIELPGIGLKSASFYILYTRPLAWVAALDVHILRHLRSIGHDAPAATPQDPVEYLALEQVFLDLADDHGVRPWVLDLFLWKMYSSGHGWDEGAFTSHVDGLLMDARYTAYVRP